MAVIAKFTTSVRSGDLPLTVPFVDMSEGGPTNWAWDFGDNSRVSRAQHPTHIYTVNGLYTVSLTVWNQSGSSVIYSTVISAFTKYGSANNEPDAWSNFQGAAWVPAVLSEYKYRYYKSVPGVRSYSGRRRVYRLDLSSHAGKIIMMRYRARLLDSTKEGSCTLDAPEGMVISNDLGLPDLFLTFNQWQDVVREIGLISSYGGGIFDIELTDGNDFMQRIGQDCQDRGGSSDYGREMEIQGTGGVSAEIISYSSSDELIKDDYIQAGPACVAYGWITIESSVVPRVPTGKDLLVTTDTEVHLIARYMPEVPEKTTKWKIKYGMPYRCQPYYNMIYEGEVEQDEEGETLTHTFDMDLMPATEKMSLVLSGTQCGKVSASRSPLMVYDNRVV